MTEKDFKIRRTIMLAGSILCGLLWGGGVTLIFKTPVFVGVIIFFVVAFVVLMAWCICAAGSDSDDIYNAELNTKKKESLEERGE